jgi:hypothetical protein
MVFLLTVTASLVLAPITVWALSPQRNQVPSAHHYRESGPSLS